MNLTTTKDIVKASKTVERQRIDAARNNMLAFVRYNMPTFESTWFHKTYYNILTEFATGKIKKLMLSVPPQHGKSTGSSIAIPAHMIGVNPDLKIATVCYSATKARKFGRKVKQLMNEYKYSNIFNTKLATRKDGDYINTAEEMDVVGHDGSLKMVGYEGGLTGDPVDILLMDDLYKDWKEANSPVIRENVWDWYVTVADTRLHNDSQQLIVFTRWHEDDLIGRITKLEETKDYHEIEDLESYEGWVRLNFEAIKTTEPNSIDPREKDEPLWGDRHSFKKLMNSKAKDPVKFDALYQGNPLNKKGRLYGKFKTYTEKPTIVMRKSYCDTADTGTDKLLDVVYDIDSDGYCYIEDIYYTDEPAEVTQPGMVTHLEKNKVSLSDIESNNGGRIFAMNIKNQVTEGVKVNWFHQGDNKEARCISTAADVMEYIIMPENWFARWPDFYSDVTNFSRVFKSNVHDDVSDVLTGITERRGYYIQNNESLFIKQCG
jgi:predicted phage terminase large subunit-like protein